MIPQNIATWIRVIVIAQAIALVVIVILAFLLRFRTRMKHYRMQMLTRKIHAILASDSQYQQKMEQSTATLFKKNPAILLKVVQQLDRELDTEHWKSLRSYLIKYIILPNARRCACSPNWEKRYLACRAYQLGIHLQDVDIIRKLIDDSAAIISIHAALIAIHYSSEVLVNAVITSFAKGRHIQQSLCAQLASNANPYLIQFVNARLLRELDPYVKVFCYEMLSNLAFQIKPIGLVHQDIYASNLELRLAAMMYLSIHDVPAATTLLLTFIEDPLWQVRARAVKLLGNIGDPAYAELLEVGLHDSEWWVRMNTAETLARLGVRGVRVLKRQTVKADRFAYEAAREVLTTLPEVPA